VPLLRHPSPPRVARQGRGKRLTKGTRHSEVANRLAKELGLKVRGSG
jgi:hypothetical protein